MIPRSVKREISKSLSPLRLAIGVVASELVDGTETSRGSAVVTRLQLHSQLQNIDREET
jgi:hypothetical protein